jgi:hypothetical protein
MNTFILHLNVVFLTQKVTSHDKCMRSTLWFLPLQCTICSVCCVIYYIKMAITLSIGTLIKLFCFSFSFNMDQLIMDCKRCKDLASVVKMLFSTFPMNGISFYYNQIFTFTKLACGVNNSFCGL